VLASQRLGIKEVDDGIWLVSFMHYDLGYFEPEQNLAIPRQPVRHEVATHVLGTFCYLCVRAGHRCAFNSPLLTLVAARSSLIFPCTHYAHAAFKLVEKIELSLQSIMSKFELGPASKNFPDLTSRPVERLN